MNYLTHLDKDFEAYDILLNETEVSKDEESRSFSQISPLMLKWSLLIFLANIWSLFSILLWPTVKAFPEDFYLLAEAVVELLLLIDICLRIIIRIFFPKMNNKLRLLHGRKSDSYILLFMVLIASVPQLLIYTILDQNGYDLNGVTFTLLIKGFRAYELFRFIKGTEKLLFYKSVGAILALKFFENLIWLFLILHFSACSWIFVNFHIEAHKGNSILLHSSS